MVLLFNVFHYESKENRSIYDVRIAKSFPSKACKNENNENITNRVMIISKKLLRIKQLMLQSYSLRCFMIVNDNVFTLW